MTRAWFPEPATSCWNGQNCRAVCALYFSSLCLPVYVVTAVPLTPRLAVERFDASVAVNEGVGTAVDTLLSMMNDRSACEEYTYENQT